MQIKFFRKQKRCTFKLNFLWIKVLSFHGPNFILDGLGNNLKCLLFCFVLSFFFFPPLFSPLVCVQILPFCAKVLPQGQGGLGPYFKRNQWNGDQVKGHLTWNQGQMLWVGISQRAAARGDTGISCNEPQSGTKLKVTPLVPWSTRVSSAFSPGVHAALHSFTWTLRQPLWPEWLFPDPKFMFKS